MERQYIGARYVPKFADPIEWQEGATYEALTVVTYMGASYTSKRAVPAGVKPTDSNYWVVTGNYNAQVEQYRQQTVNYAKEVDELKVKFNDKTGKDVIFIGDSYGDNGAVANTWCSMCASAMGLAEDKWHNLCVNGAAFSLAGRTHYIDELMGYTGNRNSITDIVLLAGMNDWTSDRLAIFTAAGELMDYIRVNYPNAKAHVGYIANALEAPFNTNALNTFMTYNSLGHLGYNVILNANASNHNYRFLADTYHPSAEANNTIGWSLASYLNGGQFGYEGYEVSFADLEPYEGLTVAQGNVKTYLNPISATVNVVIDNLLVNITEPVEWTTNSFHYIGRINTEYFHPGSRVARIPVNLAYFDGATYKSAYGTIAFDDYGNMMLFTLEQFTPHIVRIDANFTVPVINC